MSLPVTIRKADPGDFPAILSLIRELAEFERAPGKVTNTVEQMNSEKDLFSCFIAETGTGEIAGMALYFFAYYTWVGKSLYLDDLYVREKFRRQNIGSALLKKVFEVANEEGCKRLRWQVLSWNSNAIDMYRKHEAEIDAEWLNCTFDETGIAKFLNK